MLFITQDTDLIFDRPLSLVYFYASWLTFHSKTLQTITKLETKFPQVLFYAVDISHFDKLAARFKVVSLPTVQIRGNGGKLLKNTVGIIALDALEDKLSDIVEETDFDQETDQ